MDYYVYILSNKSKTLYTGVTNDLLARLQQHKAGIGSSFTAKYHCHQLVWCQRFSNVRDAISAEKQIKGWTRAKKIALIESENATWDDLAIPMLTPLTPKPDPSLRSG